MVRRYGCFLSCLEEVLGARLMFCLYIVILGFFRMVPLKKVKNLEENLAPIGRI